MSKRAKVWLAAAAVLTLAAAILLTVWAVNVINSKKLCAAIENGDAYLAEQIAEAHPACLNTVPSFASSMLATFMDFYRGDYPLCGACTEGQYELARRMVELGADPNKGEFLSPLGVVCQVKHTGGCDMAIWLCEHGADSDKVGRYSPAHNCMWALTYTEADDVFPEEDVERLFRYLYERCNTKAVDWQTVLVLSAGNGHDGILRYILDEGLCGVNDADANGSTALMNAALAGDADMVRLLLEYGADPSMKDNKGRNASDWADMAANKEDIEPIKKLLGE